MIARSAISRCTIVWNWIAGVPADRGGRSGVEKAGDGI